MAPTKIESSENPYRIYTTMRTHGRGLLEGLIIVAKLSPYESKPDELGSIHAATATRFDVVTGL